MRDIRIDLGFWEHPKTQQLECLHGVEGVKALQKLWIHAAQYRSKGVLYGMTPSYIARAGGRPGDLDWVATLVEVGFLDFDGETHSIHDWRQHNSFAFFAEERSQLATHAANARWKEKHKGKQRRNADSNAERNAPNPAPTPKPSTHVSTGIGEKASGADSNADSMKHRHPGLAEAAKRGGL